MTIGALFSYSCSLDDVENEKVELVYLATDAVEVDTILPVNKNTKLKTHFTLRNEDYRFFGYRELSNRNDTIDIVLIAQHRYINPTKPDNPKTQVETMNFIAPHSGKFVLRFWQQTDENNQMYFIEKVIDIPQN